MNSENEDYEFENSNDSYVNAIKLTLNNPSNRSILLHEMIFGGETQTDIIIPVFEGNSFYEKAEQRWRKKKLFINNKSTTNKQLLGLGYLIAESLIKDLDKKNLSELLKYNITLTNNDLTHCFEMIYYITTNVDNHNALSEIKLSGEYYREENAGKNVYIFVFKDYTVMHNYFQTKGNLID